MAFYHTNFESDITCPLIRENFIHTNLVHIHLIYKHLILGEMFSFFSNKLLSYEPNPFLKFVYFFVYVR